MSGPENRQCTGLTLNFLRNSLPNKSSERYRYPKLNTADEEEVCRKIAQHFPCFLTRSKS
jgi:hypothetical protein